jgi:hypothetical protein
VSLASGDGFGLDFLGVARQPLFITLEQFAEPFGGFRIDVVPGQAQLLCNAQKFYRGPSQIRRYALQIAPKLLFRFVKPHDDLLNVCANQF